MKHWKSLLVILCILITSFSLFAQKNDYYWLFGYSSNNIDSSYGGSTLDFNFEPVDVSYLFTPMNMYATNASICNPQGEVQLYTNGIYIANYLNEKIVGSDTLNPGYYNDEFYDLGYPVSQGALILPKTQEDSIYNVLHMKIGSFGSSVGVYGQGLYYTTVDMTQNNGQGIVTEKRVPIVEDTLVYGNLAAARHANGVDWWIVLKERGSNSFYQILFTTNGAGQVQKQTCGTNPWGAWRSATFSPDGAKYAEFAGGTSAFGKYAEIFDFDRCTGKLSNPLLLHFFDDTNFYGLAFSPSSRFLYLSSGIYIYQYDMWADDIAASKDTVAIYDGTLAPFPTTFYTAQLAPDGKIYINSPNGNNTLHVIHHPDLKGDSCMVEQNGIQLPTYNRYSMPNFPNFRLGAIPPITPSFSYSTASDTAFFQNTSVNGAHFEWDFGDPTGAGGNTATGSSVSHVYAQPGSYTVTLTVSDGCLSEVAVDTVTLVFTGVGEEMNSKIQVLPNPAKNSVYFLLPTDVPQATLTFYSTTGQPVLTQRIGFGWNSVPLEGPNGASIAPGLYFYEVKDLDRLFGSGKLVVAR